MYTVKNWETIKGKKYGKQTKINIANIYTNIEKIVDANISKTQKDKITAKDKICVGGMIEH